MSLINLTPNPYTRYRPQIAAAAAHNVTFHTLGGNTNRQLGVCRLAGGQLVASGRDLKVFLPEKFVRRLPSLPADDARRLYIAELFFCHRVHVSRVTRFNFVSPEVGAELGKFDMSIGADVNIVLTQGEFEQYADRSFPLVYHVLLAIRERSRSNCHELIRREKAGTNQSSWKFDWIDSKRVSIFNVPCVTASRVIHQLYFKLLACNAPS